jgi:hypothetical protein
VHTPHALQGRGGGLPPRALHARTHASSPGRGRAGIILEKRNAQESSFGFGKMRRRRVSIIILKGPSKIEVSSIFLTKVFFVRSSSSVSVAMYLLEFLKLFHSSLRAKLFEVLHCFEKVMSHQE